MNPEVELIELMKAIPAFTDPIKNSWSPVKLSSDPLVVARLCYDNPGQAIQKPDHPQSFPHPYIVSKGPFNYDKGQTALLSSSLKKATFWFNLYHKTQTEAIGWANAIEEALDVLFGTTVHVPFQLVTIRLTAAILVGKMPLKDDQVRTQGKEFPMQAATIGFVFGYHASQSS